MKIDWLNCFRVFLKFFVYRPWLLFVVLLVVVLFVCLFVVQNHMSGSGECEVRGVKYQMELTVHHGAITSLQPSSSSSKPQGIYYSDSIL